jgi:hypothetical protein
VIRTLLSCPINSALTNIEIKYNGILTADCIGNIIEMLLYMKNLKPTIQDCELRLFVFFITLLNLGAKIDIFEAWEV